MPSDGENWLLETGDVIISKKVAQGPGTLAPWEKLIYCLWVADYGMRNAGDLETATDLYSEFQSEGRRLAGELSLTTTYEMFSLAVAELERQYFDRFEAVCEELRRAHPRSAR